MKRYFTKQLDHSDKKLFLELEEQDIDVLVNMNGIVYCKGIDDIYNYDYDNSGSDTNLHYKDISKGMFADVDLFQIDALSGLDCGFADDEGYLISEMIATMKQKGRSCEELETFEAFQYWDGSNWEMIFLTYYDDDTGWEEETEIFQEMLLVDSDKYDFYIERHYKLADGREATETQSFYQGSLPQIEIKE